MGANVATYDEYGNEKFTYTKRKVYVMPRGVYASEFYNAAQPGLHPEITFEMTNRADYNGERLIEFEGEVYNIIRPDWKAQKEEQARLRKKENDLKKCEEKIAVTASEVFMSLSRALLKEAVCFSTAAISTHPH